MSNAPSKVGRSSVDIDGRSSTATKPHGRKTAKVVDLSSAYNSSAATRKKKASRNDQHTIKLTHAFGTCGALSVALILCVIAYGFAIAHWVDQLKTVDDAVPLTETMQQSVRCIERGEQELWAQVRSINNRAETNFFVKSLAEAASTQECGAAMLESAPELFRPMLASLGSARLRSNQATAPAYVASNYSLVVRSLCVTLLRSVAQLPSYGLLPTGQSGEPLALVMSVRLSITLLSALHYLGTNSAQVQRLTTVYTRRFQAHLALLRLLPEIVSDDLVSRFAIQCLDALGKPLTVEGSMDVTSKCSDFQDGLLADVKDRIVLIRQTIAEHRETLQYPLWVMIVVIILVFIVCVYGMMSLMTAQRDMVLELEDEIVKRKEITESVQAFVPAQFLVILGLKVITEIVVDEPLEVDVTILSSDIRQFTSISEQMTDAELFAWLQEHLACMTGACRRAGGFVEKYIGDAVLCIFEDPADSIRCAIDMQYVVAESNVTRVTRGEESVVRVGVGIHSGPALMGILGDGSTQQTAVVGRAVDVSAKLEERTKIYGAKIIVSEVTFEIANRTLEIADCRKLGEAKIDGEIIRLVEIYATEPAAVREYKTATRVNFEAAVAARDRSNIREANARFDDVLSAPRPAGYEDLAAVKMIEM
jgi:class 3 adenylate cyclase